MADIHNAAGNKALPDPIVEQIAAKSQGVPLFVEDIQRSILESGDLGRTWRTLRSTEFQPGFRHPGNIAGRGSIGLGQPRMWR